MSLSASMYSGVTGLLVHSEKMSVIGNNLANVNTNGFKASHMQFEEFIPQDISTAAGISQVGRGVSIASAYTDFGQGSFQNTSEATDMAIGGNGFFTLKKQGTESLYYSRSGEFRFDKDGYLVDPNGLVVQGWQIQSQTTATVSASTTATNSASAGVKIVGVPVDIRLQNFQSSPLETGHVDMVTNLESSQVDHAIDPVNPGFAMAGQWDGSAPTPIGSSQYAYSSSIKVYDANGATHNLTAYFDPANVPNTGGKKVWEFIVTCNPNEDGRVMDDGTNSQVVKTTSAAGLLMMGTMTFNTSGQLENMAAYTLQSSAGIGSADLKDLGNWTLADFSKDGYPTLTANFLGANNASTTDATSSNAQIIELNFGVRNTDLTGAGVTQGWTIGAGTSQADGPGTTFANMPGFNTPVDNALATTDYSTGSSTLYQSQNGYGSGFLQGVSVDKNGILTGKYSNGQVLQLFSVTLSDFNNPTGLRREGGNIFTQSRDSGPALTGQANTGTLGTISANSLEQSNVDMAAEMVDMIVTQRGFQANSKTITTVDSMLQDLINLKR